MSLRKEGRKAGRREGRTDDDRGKGGFGWTR